MNDFSVNILIGQPTIAVFSELGWQTANCFHEFELGGGSPLDRAIKSEVAFVSVPFLPLKN